MGDDFEDVDEEDIPVLSNTRRAWGESKDTNLEVLIPSSTTTLNATNSNNYDSSNILVLSDFQVNDTLTSSSPQKRIQSPKGDLPLLSGKDLKKPKSKHRSHSSSPGPSSPKRILLNYFPNDELSFPLLQNQESASTISLENLVVGSVAFQIKTNSSEKYHVTPHAGILEEGKSIRINIVMIPAAVNELFNNFSFKNDRPKDKFLIMSALIEAIDLSTDDKEQDLHSLWSSQRWKKKTLKKKVVAVHYKPVEVSSDSNSEDEEIRTKTVNMEEGFKEKAINMNPSPSLEVLTKPIVSKSVPPEGKNEDAPHASLAIKESKDKIPKRRNTLTPLMSVDNFISIEAANMLVPPSPGTIPPDILKLDPLQQKNAGKWTILENSIGFNNYTKQAINMESGEMAVAKTIQLKTEASGTPAILIQVAHEVEVMRSLKCKYLTSYIGSECIKLENDIANINLKDGKNKFDSYLLRIYSEMIPGCSIYDKIITSGPFSEVDVQIYTKQMLIAIEYLHRHGIAHKNIRSSNVLLKNDFVLLCDFGISQLEKEENIDSLYPKVLWIAPEMVCSEQTARGWKKADMWSLGCVVLEMLTGLPPWADVKDNIITYITRTDFLPAQLESNLISKNAKDFLNCCFSRNPSRRSGASSLLLHSFVGVAQQKNDSLQTNEISNQIEKDLSFPLPLPNKLVGVTLSPRSEENILKDKALHDKGETDEISLSIPEDQEGVNFKKKHRKANKKAKVSSSSASPKKKSKSGLKGDRDNLTSPSPESLSYNPVVEVAIESLNEYDNIDMYKINILGQNIENLTIAMLETINLMRGESIPAEEIKSIDIEELAKSICFRFAKMMQWLHKFRVDITGGEVKKKERDAETVSKIKSRRARQEKKRDKESEFSSDEEDFAKQKFSNTDSNVPISPLSRQNSSREKKLKRNTDPEKNKTYSETEASTKKKKKKIITPLTLEMESESVNSINIAVGALLGAQPVSPITPTANSWDLPMVSTKETEFTSSFSNSIRIDGNGLSDSIRSLPSFKPSATPKASSLLNETPWGQSFRSKSSSRFPRKASNTFSSDYIYESNLYINVAKTWVKLARENVKLRQNFHECVLLLEIMKWKQVEIVQLKSEEDAVVNIMKACNHEIKKEIGRLSSLLVEKGSEEDFPESLTPGKTPDESELRMKIINDWKHIGKLKSEYERRIRDTYSKLLKEARSLIGLLFSDIQEALSILSRAFLPEGNIFPNLWWEDTLESTLSSSMLLNTYQYENQPTVMESSFNTSSVQTENNFGGYWDWNGTEYIWVSTLNNFATIHSEGFEISKTDVNNQLETEETNYWDWNGYNNANYLPTNETAVGCDEIINFLENNEFSTLEYPISESIQSDVSLEPSEILNDGEVIPTSDYNNVSGESYDQPIEYQSYNYEEAYVRPVLFQAKAMANYEAADFSELSLQEADIISVLSLHESGWWEGEIGGNVGWFPSTFVQKFYPLFSIPEEEEILTF